MKDLSEYSEKKIDKNIKKFFFKRSIGCRLRCYKSNTYPEIIYHLKKKWVKNSKF